MPKTPRADSVFINCPFDQKFWPLFEALAFGVLACGFQPRSALEASDSGDVRLDKILRLIDESRFAIHDLSRVELDHDSGLPRFNMPFELGLDIGHRRFSRRAKKILILDREKYRYQKYLSDISGQDIRAHQDTPDLILKHVRDWLRTESGRSSIPGDQSIRVKFKQFSDALPRICAELGLERNELQFADYVGLAQEALGRP